MRSTIRQDIAAIADVFDRSGRHHQPIKIIASQSTIEKAAKLAPSEFHIHGKPDSRRFYFNGHPIELLQK